MTGCWKRSRCTHCSTALQVAWVAGTGMPSGGVCSWFALSMPSPSAGLGHCGVAAVNACSPEHRTRENRGSCSGFWSLCRNTLWWFMVIFFRVPSLPGLNLPQQSCTFGHILWVSLEYGWVASMWGAGRGWIEAGLFPGKRLLADQMWEDEGKLLTHTVWKGIASCFVMVCQAIALQKERQQN